MSRLKIVGALWVVLQLSIAAAGRTEPIHLEFLSAVSDDYLNPHNSARQIVGAGITNLTWDDGLATYATNWSKHQATQDNCNLIHSGGPYGENIFWASFASTPEEAVQAWVNEKQYYDYASNLCLGGQICGHYTQVVWRNTLRLGCGSTRCSIGGGTFVVCSYDPPGNYIGERPY